MQPTKICSIDLATSDKKGHGCNLYCAQNYRAYFAGSSSIQQINYSKYDDFISIAISPIIANVNEHYILNRFGHE